MKRMQGSRVAVAIAVLLATGCGGMDSGAQSGSEVTGTVTQRSVAGASGNLMGLMAWKSALQDELARTLLELRVVSEQESLLARQCNSGQLSPSTCSGQMASLAASAREREVQVAQLESQIAVVQDEIESVSAENRQDSKDYYGNPFGG